MPILHKGAGSDNSTIYFIIMILMIRYDLSTIIIFNDSMIEQGMIITINSAVMILTIVTIKRDLSTITIFSDLMIQAM